MNINTTGACQRIGRNEEFSLERLQDGMTQCLASTMSGELLVAHTCTNEVRADTSTLDHLLDDMFVLQIFILLEPR